MSIRTAIPNRFAGKTALVTGGTAGIGHAIATELMREGCKVAVSTLPADAGAGREAFSALGFAPLILEGDMANEAFCRQLVGETAKQFGPVHFLVNNAFSFVAAGLDGRREDFERSLQVGPLAFVMMAQEFCRHRSPGGGAIVNVSSISGAIAQPDRWTYNGSKGMVNQLTKCMAMDLAALGVRVNSVSPGWIWTRENEKAAAGDPEKYRRLWGDYCMLRRLGQASEVAAAVLFLLSEDASFITGTDLPVDGGYQSLGPEGLGQNTVIAGTPD